MLPEQVLQVPQDHKDHKDHRVHLDLPDHADHKDHKDHRDHRAPLGLRVRRGSLVALDHLADQLVPQDHKEPQVQEQLALVD